MGSGELKLATALDPGYIKGYPPGIRENGRAGSASSA